ncbi:sensor domain-containing protein [Mycobacterium sp.]|uniref:sensor domain-containing protein n=1 Tax=Mycobacterium sp. TaxID=1785 RepID=UPI003F9CA6CE
MTNPFSYDPLGRAPIGPPAEPPEEFPEPAEPPSPPRVNSFATLSLVYAFVFAPAGAILGHLGLAQIRRTGQQGRQRALAGLTLSYVFIALAVVGLVVWATLVATGSNQTAAPGSAPTAAPPPPTVAPNDLTQLLPGLADVRNITGDHNLAVGQTWDHVGRHDREGSIDRAECWGSIGPGTPDAYNVEAVFGYRASEFSDNRDPQNPLQVIAGVAAFRDESAAQTQLTNLLSGWRQCGGSDVKLTLPSAQVLTFSLGLPTDAGNGITTMDVATKGLVPRHSVRAIAAKANVVIDLDLSYVASSGSTTDRPQQASQQAGAIANFILGKVPG